MDKNSDDPFCSFTSQVCCPQSTLKVCMCVLNDMCLCDHEKEKKKEKRKPGWFGKKFLSFCFPCFCAVFIGLL